MESEIETMDSDKKGWIGKIKDWSYENWQTILVILIILIVGVSAYNYNQQNNSSNENQGSTVITDNDKTEVEIENINEENNTAQEEDKEETTEADIEKEDQEEAAEEDGETEIVNDEEENKEENTSVISTIDNSGKTYTVYANYGEGITHLARRALNEYLQETGEGNELSKEHKIYIEDYLQNRTGAGSIEINHQGTFSESLMREAISSAKQLTPSSINNLKKYIK